MRRRTLRRRSGNSKAHGQFESSETGGKKLPADELKGLIVTFDGDKHTVKKGDEVIQVGTQKLDPSKSPRTITVTMTEGPNKGTVMLGIYEIDGDTLKVCFDPQGKKRPTEFKSRPVRRTSSTSTNASRSKSVTRQKPKSSDPCAGGSGRTKRCSRPATRIRLIRPYASSRVSRLLSEAFGGSTSWSDDMPELGVHQARS